MVDIPVSSAGPTTAASLAPPTGPTTSTLAQPVETVPAAPTAAEAGGWRLAVTAPTAGATIGASPVLCYSVAGTSREPVVVFEVSVLTPGTTTGGSPIRVDGSVGRGSVEVGLGDVADGRYDLRVQLVANGAPVEGVVVTIPMVIISATAARAPCDSG